MAKRSSPKSSKPDPTEEALLAVSEAILDVHFLQDDAAEDYLAEKPGGISRGTRPKVLDTAELSGGAIATLHALPQPDRFRIQFQHPKFTATVDMTYDVQEGISPGGKLVNLSGDRRAARRAGDQWLDEAVPADVNALLESVFPDDDEDDLPEPEANPGRPPAATADDADRVQSIAAGVAQALRSGASNPDVSLADSVWLEQTPQALWPLLDQTVAASLSPADDEALVQAYVYLLGMGLQLIRYRIDAGWDWAREMSRQYQERMVALGREGRLSSERWFPLVQLIAEARIPIEPDTREALADAGLKNETAPSGAAALDKARGLLDTLAETMGSPFEVIEVFSGSAAVMTEATRSFMTHEFALSPHPLLRGTVPLMLLDQAQDVRRAAAAALERIALPETLSPESLRRMIAIRNWIPAADRPVLDQAIRKARSKGVECAQWPDRQDLLIMGTIVDGAGAHSIISGSRTGRMGIMANVLLKMGSGVGECWIETEMPRRAIKEVIDSLKAQAPCAEIDRVFVDFAVQNALAAGLATCNLPPANFVDFAERFGGGDWRDRRLDIRSEAARLVDELTPAQRTGDAIRASFNRSGQWLKNLDPMADSWFEEGPEIASAIARAPRRDRQGAVQQLLQDVMPGRRSIWTERFLLMALWAHAAKDKKHHARWPDFAILAHELSGERPLSDVPIMKEIALRSVAAAASQRW